MNYIDLKLPSGKLWAEENLPGYYAWGDLESHTSEEANEFNLFSPDYNLYKFVENYQMTKYNNVDNLTKLESIDDVGTEYEGHIPTVEEWKELFNNTEFNTTFFNDTKYIKLTKGDQYLLIPLTGYIVCGRLYCKDEGAILWTSELRDPLHAYTAGLAEDERPKTDILDCAMRYTGLPIRLVKNES